MDAIEQWGWACGREPAVIYDNTTLDISYTHHEKKQKEGIELSLSPPTSPPLGFLEPAVPSLHCLPFPPVLYAAQLAF